MRNDKELTKYISSFVMGDGSIQIDKRDYYKNGNAWFSCSQIHKPYLEWKAEKLQDLTRSTISFVGKRGFATHDLYALRTSRHPFFNSFRDRLYGTGRKCIDPHYLELFDEESLAVWYMDDGVLCKDKQDGGLPRYRVRLCTQAYTLAENLLLKDFIKERYFLEFNIRKIKAKDGGTLYVLLLGYKDQVKKFCETVSPFILDDYKYKITLDYSRMVDSKENLDDDIV